MNMNTGPEVVLFAALFLSLSAQAETIQFTGRVVDESCQVDTAASTGGLTVALGDIPKSTVADPGTKSPDTPFSIVLTGCPTSDSQISLSFSGDTNASNSSLLQTTVGSGSVAAEGVGIAIFDNTSGTPASTPMDIGAVAKTGTVATDSTGKATFDFIANIMNDGGTVAAGDANATATITVNYE